MKKLILIPLLFLFSVTLFAQSFIILDETMTDVSNTAYTIIGDANGVIKGHMDIVNTTAGTASFKAKKIEDNVLTNGTLCRIF